MKTKWVFLLIAMMVMGNGFCQDFGWRFPANETAPTIFHVFTDSRGISLGNSGAASEADVFSMYYNPAKYAFIKDKTTFGLSYVPWMRGLSPDMNLADLAFARKVGKVSAIAASIRYLNMGEITIRDEESVELVEIHPTDFALDFAYSARLTEHLSLAAAVRFVSSKDYPDAYPPASASSLAGDLGLYYQQPLTLGEKEAQYALGVSITNIGGKMKYSETFKKFLPATLRVGGAFKTELIKEHTLTAMMDFSKLLVPTPPSYSFDPLTGEYVIDAEFSDDVSVLQGMIQSFYDAPKGFSEELKEVIWSLGLEYAWKEKWFGRVGYYHESQYKGNQKFFTLGAGANFKRFGVDVSYLISANGMYGIDPMKNMLSIGFRYGF
ncbi:MAG: type IX secretion system outer membrane channel protein PorV [Bacteroidales bacterium]|nr:type IX secretion system outer membrane channel protein PorV [Bacteroidales bacterium]